MNQSSRDSFCAESKQDEEGHSASCFKVGQVESCSSCHYVHHFLFLDIPAMCAVLYCGDGEMKWQSAN